MPITPMPAKRSSGGNSELSAAHFARNDRPMNSTMAPTRATVLPPNSQAFARATSTSIASGFAGAMTAGCGALRRSRGSLGRVVADVSGYGESLRTGDGNVGVKSAVAMTELASIG